MKETCKIEYTADPKDIPNEFWREKFPEFEIYKPSTGEEGWNEMWKRATEFSSAFPNQDIYELLNTLDDKHFTELKNKIPFVKLGGRFFLRLERDPAPKSSKPDRVIDGVKVSLKPLYAVCILDVPEVLSFIRKLQKKYKKYLRTKDPKTQ